MLTIDNQHTTQNQTAEFAQRHMQVTPPGALDRVKWALLRGLLASVGRASKGIRISYRYGFDSGTMLDYLMMITMGSIAIELMDTFWLPAST
jgi:hypothetical protein